MNTDEKFARADVLRGLAEEALALGDVEKAESFADEMEGLQSEAEKESNLTERLAKAHEATMKPVNEVPVASADVAEDSKNYKRGDGTYQNHVDANYKPAGFQKDLPAMAQISWVRDKMGANLKAEAAFQTDTWLKWFTSKSQDEFFRNASADEVKAMQEDTDNEGGYFVPEEFINSTYVIPEANGGQLRDSCTVLRVNSKDGYVPTLDSVAMDYLSEESAYTGVEVTPTVGQVEFGVLKIAGLTRVSDELLADSVPNLPALLSQIFTSANGRFQDKEILAGNGTNRYNGIGNGTDGAGSSVTYSTLANATSVVAADIVTAYFAVPQQQRGVDGFRWVFPSAISALINGIGTTAAGIHAIDSLTNAPDAFLMGRQVLNVDVTGQPFGTTITSTEKIGLAGNMSAYYLFERAGMSIRRNDSLYMGRQVSQTLFVSAINSIAPHDCEVMVTNRVNCGKAKVQTKPIRSEASRACEERSETRRSAEIAARNTSLAPDNFDIHTEVDEIVRASLKDGNCSNGQVGFFATSRSDGRMATAEAFKILRAA